MLGKKLLVVSLLAAACGSAVAQQQDWAGLYLGAQVGQGWSEQKYSYVPGGVNQGGVRLESSGVIGGVTAGYNWQSSNLVFGVEGDLSAGDISESVNKANGGVPCYVEGCKNKVSSAASVRGRVGYVINGFMPYLTIGGTYAHIKGSADLGACHSDSCRFSSDKWGMTYGVGLEWRYNANWSAKVEYLYTELDSPRFTYNSVRTTDPDFSVVRLGVNYRF